ncbi:rRNA-processing protein UTP23-like [Oopsacas minuta]|uniref:rRNA-processing protein UTP23 homolog n=1 Tax=Oopsacas minuta TaxID=111878 RepID=A0AAV7JVR4_9METZ|nr:rRNA-processing protein UTP23-like [Oopsacas minuta]
MKYKRKKQAKRILQLLRTTFHFHEPFQILIDGTFCQSALEHKINIRDQLSNYLSASVRLFTTKCAVNEINSLGEPFKGGLYIIKQYKYLKCNHDNKHMAAECFLGLVGEENKNRYMVATLDRSLKFKVREIPGTPILTLANNALVLEAPSLQTKIKSDKIEYSKLCPSRDERNIIAGLKAQLPKVSVTAKINKRKIPKGPNPMSRKVSKQVNTVTKKKGTADKSKQRRVRKMKQKAHLLLSKIEVPDKTN